MFDFMVKLLPFLMSAMGIAEKCLGPKTGKEKKELVMEGARVVTDGFEDLSTGGQRATWERISEPFQKKSRSRGAMNPIIVQQEKELKRKVALDAASETENEQEADNLATLAREKILDLAKQRL